MEILPPLTFEERLNWMKNLTLKLLANQHCQLIMVRIEGEIIYHVYANYAQLPLKIVDVISNVDKTTALSRTHPEWRFTTTNGLVYYLE